MAFDVNKWRKEAGITDDIVKTVANTNRYGYGASETPTSKSKDTASSALESNNPAYAALQKYGDGKTGTAANKAVKGTSTQSTERKAGQINALGAGSTTKKTKLDSTLNAAVYNTVGSLANLWGTIQALDESLKGTDEYTAVGGLNKITDREGDKKRAMEANRVKSVLNTADSLMQRSAEEQAEAKEGLGKFGQGLVDFGVAGAQFAGDVMANAILPGSGLAAMGARAAGGGAYEARQAGLDLDQQITAGAKSAAIEVLTEKLFGAGSKIAYGKGIVKNQNVVNSLVNRLAKTDKGRTALKMLTAANEEGLEEVLSDVLNPAADIVLNLRDSEGNLLDELSAEQMLEDYIIGAALGAFGSGANVISGQYKAENAQQREYEAYQKALVDAGLATEQGSNAQVTAEEYKKIIDQSSKRGSRNLSDKETENMLNLLHVEQDAPDISARLQSLGQDADTETVNAIVKAVNGEKLSTKEQKAFNANPYSQRVVNEMTDTEGVTSNGWYADRASGAAYTPQSTGISAEVAQQALDTQMAQRAVAGTATFNPTAQAEGVKAVAQAIAQETEAAPEFIQKVYDLNPQADPIAFKESFKAAYTMGETGGNVEALQHVPTLTQAQARIAYTMGADKAKAATNTQEAIDNGIHLRESSERIDSQNTVGQVSGLAEGTGRNSGGQAQSRPADSTGAAQANGQIVYNGTVQKGVKRTTGKKTSSMRKAAKAAEARGYSVTFFEGGNIKVEGGEARGVVNSENKTVMVRTDHPDFTAHQIMRHELGHADIAEGKESLDSIRKELHKDFTDSELDAMAQAYAEAYEGSGMTAEEAFEEICCDALGEMNIFSDDGREILQRYGELLTKAKKSAERQANQGRAPPRDKGGVMYSREVNGKKIAWIENSPLTAKELQDYSKVAAYIANHIGEAYTIIESGNKVYIGKDLPGEYTHSKYTTALFKNRPAVLRAKNKAIGSFGEIIEIATNRQWEKAKHADNKDAKYGVYRYNSAFAFPVKQNGKITSIRAYDVELIILNASDGKKYLYDIVDIRENTADEFDLMKRDQRKQNASARRDVSENSISTESEDVKKKYSLEPGEAERQAKINSAMTMDEAKRMIDTAFKVCEIRKYSDGEYQNAEQWLREAGSDEVEMYIDNEWTLQEKYINSNQDILDEEYMLSEVLDAYLAGTLVGKEKPKAKRMDTSKSYSLKDERFYAPKNIEDAKKLLSIANEKLNDKNRTAVNNARAKILLFAHNKGAAELLGMSQAELNKKLRSWSAYSASAKKISEQANSGVAESNRWTGIENCSYIYKTTVSDEDVERLVGSIKGSPNNHEKRYIARVMLAADTHISYKGLNFVFESKRDVNARFGNPNGRTNGFYSPGSDTVPDTIVCSFGAPETVAHEMGHYIDTRWGRDLVGAEKGALFLTRGVNEDMIRTRHGNEGVQFAKNFKIFIDKLTDVNNTMSAYTNDSAEVFARFFARFVEWTDNIATGRKAYSYESTMYGDNFTTAHYVEFIKLLQEKAMLDAKYETGQSGVKFSREQQTRKNIKVSRQAWAQIQSRRMLKYGGRVDTMPNMDYIFANDNLFVVNNYDETRFTIVRKIDPAKDKALADQIVEAIKNGSITNTGKYNSTAEILRDNARRGNGDNVHAGNGRAAGSNARLDDMAGRPSDRRTTADKGRRDNGLSHSLEPKKLTELRRENEQLKARVEYWRGQTKPTTVKAVRADDVNRLAREIINMSETDLKPKDIVPQLTKLGEHILNEKELRFTDISNMARRIAVNIVENATTVANEEDVQTHNELKDYLKQHKFKDDGSTEFKDIRNRYKRRFRFDKNGMGVDTAYMELNDMFGEGYFPSDIINTADQLERIGQVLDNTAPEYVNPNDTYFEDAVSYLRNYILEGVLSDQIRQVAPTYADKANAKLAKANAEKARLASEVKQGKKAMTQLQEQNEKRVKEAIRAERKRAQQELKQFKDDVHRRDANRRETAEKNRYKAQISKNLKALSDWLLKPDHKNALKHIPGPLQSTVRDFIASVDFTSTSMLNGRGARQKDMRYLENLERLHSYITDQNTSEERYSGYFDLPPTFETELSQFIRRVNALARANSGVYTVNAMDSTQLRQLSDIIKTLKKTITDMNKMYQNATFRHAYDAGAADVENLQKITKSKVFTNNVVTNKLDRMLMWTEARPAHAFQRFGKGGESIYREFTDGQCTMAFLTKDIIDFTSELYKKNKVDVKAWEKQVHTFKFDGDEISITTPQLMGLYELNKRASAKQHLDSGGFKVANFKEKLKLKRDTASTGHVLTEQQLSEMFDKLTEAQKKTADEMQSYMAIVGGSWGNYVSVKRFDVEMFKDEHYYPIKVDTSETDSKENDKVDNASLYKLLNMGFTKELSPKANQAIVIYDIFDVFANHMAEMAQYRSFALPVLDAMKWFNYKERNANGTVRASLRAEMGRAFGTDQEGRSFAEDFIKGVLQAYNGAEARGDNSLNARMLNRVNRQAVAFNTRVMIQQPSAIARAALYLDAKDLVAGLKNYTVVAAKKSIEEMHRYSGIAVWKDLGFYDVNVSRGVQELIKNSQNVVSKINEFGMKGAEWADKLTWAAMWDASKAKIKRETKLTEQDEDFFPKVVELFEDTIYNTQVVDTVMTKSAYSRDKRFSTRILSSFMSEPMTTASLVTNQIFKMQMQRAEGKKLTGSDYKQLGKVSAVVAIAAVVNSALASLADAWRDDDEYATFGQKWENAFRTKLADELMPISYLPFGSLVWNTYKIYLDSADKKYFGLDVYGNETNIPWADMVDNLTKALDIFAEIEEKGEDSRYTKYGGYYKIAQTLSQLAGIPISNVVREAVSAYNNFAENKIRSYEPSPESAIKYAWDDGYLSDEEAMKWLQNDEAMDGEALSEGDAYLRIEQWKANESSAYFKVYDAIDNGGNVKEAVDEMLDHGKEEKNVKTAITNHCKEKYIKGTEAERKKIRQALYDTGLYGSVNDVIEKCNNWLK